MTPVPLVKSPPSITTTTISPTNTVPLFTWDTSVAHFKVPLGAYLETYPKLGGVCVGAFVFDNASRLLLVQRAPHDSYPLRWEVPGGTIDAGDETLLHGVSRELWEETGLRVTHVSGLVGKGYTFLTRHPVCVCKYSFIVDVEAYNVKLDPNEHTAFLWVTEDEVKEKKCGDLHLVYTTKNQQDTILDAFETRRKTVEA
ncbi:hypothetical protein GQX73_g6128 [Xylaria multiplex]|uniref:Nudix hydrolase domain-containing protein n=1 Tax=Xylaria multiplex TaxID=323545 RepID=A0A7C8IN52_9PEZI|nr:hypothetical protein GQX73_g6128 [Xylaria multiplex]